MKKRVMAFVLVLLMVFSLVPTSVYAADAGEENIVAAQPQEQNEVQQDEGTPALGADANADTGADANADTGAGANADAGAESGTGADAGNAVTAVTGAVILVTNGGILKAEEDDVTEYTPGTTCPLPALEKTGYTFKGWYETEDFSGSPVVEIPADATGNKTYYAKWAAEGFCGKSPSESSVTWALSEDGTLTISGSGAMMDYSSGTQPWATHKSSIKKVVFENGVTSVGNNAFSGIQAINEVVFADSVLSIGVDAFYNTGSVQLTLPAKLETIGESAFQSCHLGEVTLPASLREIGPIAFLDLDRIYLDENNQNFCLENDILYNKDKTVLVGYYGSSDAYFPSVVIPETVKEIKERAFVWRKIGALTLPSGLETIGKSAFSQGTILSKLTIPKSVKEIGSNAFSSIPGLKYVEFEEGTTSINYFYAILSGCRALEYAVIPESVTEISNNLFGTILPKKLTIYGETGSYAETYAAGKGIAFKDIKTNPISLYSVILYKNGGALTSGQTDKTYYMTNDTEAARTLPILKRTGYDFKGWYEDEAFSGEPVAVIPADATGDKTYYAKWEKPVQVFQVTLNKDGGTLKAGAVDVTQYTQGTACPLPILEKAGYTFKGWFEEKSSTGQPVVEIPADATGNKTYVAVWEVIPTATPSPTPTSTPIPSPTSTPKPTSKPVTPTWPTSTPIPIPTSTPTPSPTPTPKPIAVVDGKTQYRPEPVITNGVAKVDFDDTKLEDMLNSLKPTAVPKPGKPTANVKPTGTLELAPQPKPGTDKVSVNLAKDTLEKLEKETRLDLSIETENGGVKLPNKTVGKLSGQAKGEDLKVDITKVEKEKQ